MGTFSASIFCARAMVCAQEPGSHGSPRSGQNQVSGSLALVQRGGCGGAGLGPGRGRQALGCSAPSCSHPFCCQSLCAPMQAPLAMGLLCLPGAVFSLGLGKTPARCSGEQEHRDVVSPERLFLAWFLRRLLLARSPPQGGGRGERSTLSFPSWLRRAARAMRLMDATISLALGTRAPCPWGADMGPGYSASTSQAPQCRRSRSH